MMTILRSALVRFIGYGGSGKEHILTEGDIRRRCWLTFLLRFGLILVIFIYFGLSRIGNYAESLRSAAAASTAEQSQIDLKEYIIHRINGGDIKSPNSEKSSNATPFYYEDQALTRLLKKCWIVLFTLLLCAVWFTWTWWRLVEYIVATRFESDGRRVGRPNTLTQVQFDSMQSLFEPAGDIFTIIGIGFTFLGLSLGLLSLPSDILSTMSDAAQLVSSGSTTASGSNDAINAVGPKEQISGATAMFGTSLSLGLLASLFGVLLSIAARKMQGCHSGAVQSPIMLSDQFGHLSHLSKLPQARSQAPHDDDFPSLARKIIAASERQSIILEKIASRLQRQDNS